VSCLAFSPDGKTLASGGRDGTIALWEIAADPRHDAPALNLRRRIQAPAKVAASIAFSPDGSTLASTAVASVAFSPDGSTLASTAVFDAHARLWDAATGVAKGALGSHRTSTLGVAFSPDGKLLATSGDDGAVRLWDLATGRLVDSLEPSAPESNRWIWSTTFSPDGRSLAAAGNRPAPLLWRLADRPAPKLRPMNSRLKSHRLSPL
jgi:WD40 repeat protein